MATNQLLCGFQSTKWLNTEQLSTAKQLKSDPYYVGCGTRVTRVYLDMSSSRLRCVAAVACCNLYPFLLQHLLGLPPHWLTAGAASLHQLLSDDLSIPEHRVARLSDAAQQAATLFGAGVYQLVVSDAGEWGDGMGGLGAVKAAARQVWSAEKL